MTQFIWVNFFAITTWIYFYWCRLSRDSEKIFLEQIFWQGLWVFVVALIKKRLRNLFEVDLSYGKMWKNVKKRIRVPKKLQNSPKTSKNTRKSHKNSKNTQKSHRPHLQHNNKKFAFYYVLITIISIKYKSKFKKETANEIDLHSRSQSIEKSVSRQEKLQLIQNIQSKILLSPHITV